MPFQRIPTRLCLMMMTMMMMVLPAASVAFVVPLPPCRVRIGRDDLLIVSFAKSQPHSDTNGSTRPGTQRRRRRRRHTTNNNKSTTHQEPSSSSPSCVVSSPGPNSDTLREQQAPIQTIGGGSAMIFEMARRMSIWNDAVVAEEEEEQQSTGPSPDSDPRSGTSATVAMGGVLPRWRPMPGISDFNPNFRTKAPTMNNQGYASTIWRNVRKNNKPSLWRHALRTYQRMSVLVQDEQQQQDASALKIRRSNIHFEGGLVACSKLGLWQEALQIYKTVEESATTNQTALIAQAQDLAARRRPRFSSATQVCVTHHMVLSVISACVRGSRRLVKEGASMAERRAPLDAAVELLTSLEVRHGIPLEARHLNPVAAAYQSLGISAESIRLLETYLTDRKSRPESENGDDPFNINDVGAKDKASYALLVKGAVSSGDWSQAVDSLRNMTEAGLYPKARHLNVWTEVSERKTKQRATRSWKKKRDEYWLESVR